MSGTPDVTDAGGVRKGQVVPMRTGSQGRGSKGRGTAFMRGDHVELAERLVSDMRSKGAFVFTENMFVRYDSSGIFVPVTPHEVHRHVMTYAGLPVKPDSDRPRQLKLSHGAVVGVEGLARALAADPTFFEAARHGVAFADCFVEVSASGITQRPHSEDHRARFAYDFRFLPTEQPEGLLAFFESCFRDDEPADRAAKIALYQEFVGVSMLGFATRYQRALVQVGDGANGKSVASSIIESCMPTGSVCSIPPQDFGQEYRRAMLAGKLLNIVSELPEADIMDSESWKAIVSGDSISARPIRQEPFNFRPVAGHIYSANRLPGTTDHTGGFWRRMMVVQFNRVFAQAEQDSAIAERIIAAERPAIVAWALAGAQRLLANGQYTMPPSAAESLASWKRASDQVLAFVEERCARLPLDAPTSTWFPSAKLYDNYKAWASDNGHRAMASNKFAERMKLLDLGVRKGMHGNMYPVRLSGGEMFRD